MKRLKQGLDVWMEVADRLPELQDLDVSEMADFRGRYLANKILGNSDIEADYSTLTLYRCMLLSPIDNALNIGTYNYANTGKILERIHTDLSLANVHMQGGGAELKNANAFRIRITDSLIENYTFKTCYLRDCDFHGSRFVNVSFLGAKLYNCNFESCSFEKCTFDDVYDDDVWLDNTEIDEDCNFQHTRFENTKPWWFIYDVTPDELNPIFKGSNIAGSASSLPSIM